MKKGGLRATATLWVLPEPTSDKKTLLAPQNQR